jgi:hypothetical protein
MKDKRIERYKRERRLIDLIDKEDDFDCMKTDGFGQQSVKVIISEKISIIRIVSDHVEWWPIRKHFGTSYAKGSPANDRIEAERTAIATFAYNVLDEASSPNDVHLHSKDRQFQVLIRSDSSGNYGNRRTEI